jgi:hypothetical protein
MTSRTLKIAFSLLLSAVILTSCSTIVVAKKGNPSSQGKKVPPGQAKKATGSQSAKPYAPGQQKKKN